MTHVLRGRSGANGCARTPQTTTRHSTGIYLRTSSPAPMLGDWKRTPNCGRRTRRNPELDTRLTCRARAASRILASYHLGEPPYDVLRSAQDHIDLSTGPPPDLVVEVDITSPSKRKLGIYAKLGVPELWVWTGAQLHIYELGRGSYAERPTSIALPFLSAETLTSFVQQRITEGHKRTVIASEWLRTHKPAAQ
ncbi:MAG: Uma2 family endonuclease [Pyrinomonadaceae bacterium]